MENIIAYKTKGYKLIKADFKFADGLVIDFLQSVHKPTIDKLVFIEEFNSLSWEEKVRNIFPKINDYVDEERQAYVQDSIECYFDKKLQDADKIEFEKTYIGLDSLKSADYICNSIKTLKNLRFFDRKSIPEQTKAFVQKYIDMIESVELSTRQKNAIYEKYAKDTLESSEYCIYIGDKSYQGCIGKLLEPSDRATLMRIEFFKKKDGSDANIIFKCKRENIVTFTI